MIPSTNKYTNPTLIPFRSNLLPLNLNPRTTPINKRPSKRSPEIKTPALPQASRSSVTTPHSGYHFDGTDRRFFEGWYWRITLPGDGQSFALIYSIEDPHNNTAPSPSKPSFSGIGAQIMGPDDGYLLQYSKDVDSFWADRSSLALGATFLPKQQGKTPPKIKSLVNKDIFNASIAQGFQASATFHQGTIIASENGAAGADMLKSTVSQCSWEFQITPLTGWGGDTNGRQRATAGWLASLPIFEPHWQVLMSHGTATGSITWNEKVYEFTDAPAYAEKNWGGGFPSKWCWIQCNSFKESPGTSVTAVGARRGLLQVPGVQEDVGLIGIHYGGKFFELNVKDGKVEWDVAPWGLWSIKASNKDYDAIVEATCDAPGTPLRAPTADLGLAPFCRDSFGGRARIRVWRKGEAKSGGGGGGGGVPIIDCMSDGCSAAVEVGGGPWWSEWKTEAEMAEPIKQLLNLPIDIEMLSDFLPKMFRPPGL